MISEQAEKYIKKLIKPRITHFEASPGQWSISIRFNPEIDEQYIKRIELFVCDRFGDATFHFPIDTVTKDDDEFWVAKVLVQLSSVQQHFFNREFWDFFVSVPVDQSLLNQVYAELDVDQIDEAEKVSDLGVNAEVESCKLNIRLRAVKPLQPLDLFSLYDEEKDKMLVPFYTKKKALSLRVEEVHVMARIDHAAISRHFMLNLEGHVVFPIADVLSKPDVQKKLMLVNSDEEVIAEWRAENIERLDLTEAAQSLGRNYDWAGFSLAIDLKPIASQFSDVSEPTYLYFRLELTHNKNGMLFSERPVRILARQKVITGRHIIKMDGLKKSLTVKRNRNNSLAFRIAPYTLADAAKGKVRRGLNRVKKSKAFTAVYHRTFQLLSHLPVKQNLVMFESFFGRQYSCNPRAIYEYMRDHYPEYQLVWSANGNYTELFEQHQLPYVKRFSLKWLMLMTRANYWVTNVRLPLWMSKPKHTVYLQTWHGTPLKRLALDMEEVHMPGTNTEKYKRNFLAESSRWDYLISPNAYSSEIFSRAFGFENTMIESGYPRNDFLYQKNNRETIDTIKDRCGLPRDKKVILYAPTWRDNQFYGKGRYRFELDLDLQRMKENLGKDYIIIMRMHYLIADQLDLSEYDGFAYDFSHYEDISELYMISDLLITDYSSVFFDFANLKRPMVFFTYDIEDYRDHLRGFYFEFEQKAPGPLVTTTEGVIQAIHDIEASGFAVSDRFDAFFEKFCSLESGHSSEKVVKTVFK
ncbi:CDP-glycerol glycerophosphotransferase family protein [Sporolactobacillus laevolacticus]|uniref:CDP-glycerol glycerophosphotransferase family protein n=1 Tax=Sporolactobacillus laevolacticus TaxID=33018 RepID=UPI0025B2CB63|nr:CDP-glycerol glycerophosphotransferase family protein [Sporolactobacillus laevolacticus]MDN3954156.1 CDP-glycerol glycerophosphotransferase family protein [Sporolactobacillus laevolacticus]